MKCDPTRSLSLPGMTSMSRESSRLQGNVRTNLVAGSFDKANKANKSVVDNRLLAPSRNDPFGYNPQPCIGVELPVAGATP